MLRGEEDPDCSISRIGDLLVRKAEEGVRVLLLIWNDVSRLLIMVFCDF